MFRKPFHHEVILPHHPDQFSFCRPETFLVPDSGGRAVAFLVDEAHIRFPTRIHTRLAFVEAVVGIQNDRLSFELVHQFQLVGQSHVVEDTQTQDQIVFIQFHILHPFFKKSGFQHFLWNPIHPCVHAHHIASLFCCGLQKQTMAAPQIHRVRLRANLHQHMLQKCFENS